MSDKIDWNKASLEFWRDGAKRLREENILLQREISELRDPGGKRFAEIFDDQKKDVKLPQDFIDCFKGLTKKDGE